MAENISMTRIVDLPDINTQSQMNSAVQPQMQQMPMQQMSQGLATDAYIPMNIHPNPYGIPKPPPGGILPPQQTTSSTMSEKNYVNELDNIQQRLPQRDIPMDPLRHIQDVEVQPNYIPPPKVTYDYIQEYQVSTDKKIKEYELQKKTEQKREEWLEELQMPILVSLIYFVFQLPIVNTLLFKRFSFLSIYREDGNFNLVGLTLKCVFFGSVFYLLEKIMNMM